MAEQPKMTEFEMALEAAEKAQSSPKASRVHWPAPGAAGSAYPAPPAKTGAKAGAPQLVPTQKPPGAHTEENPEKAGTKKPPTAIIAAAVALVVIAGIVFLMTKKKGGSAELTVADTTVSEPAVTPAPVVRPTGGGGGGGAAAPAAPTASAAPKGSTSGAPKQSTPSTGPAATTPAAPTTPAEPTYLPINADKLEQLKAATGISYPEAVSIVGGEGKKVADGVEPSTGDQVTVYEWPAEGLDGKFVQLKFVNGMLNKINVV